MTQSITSSVKHGGVSVTVWPCVPANGTVTLAFIDDFTADRATRRMQRYTGGFCVLGFSQTPKLKQRHVIIQADNNPKHQTKTTKKAFQGNKVEHPQLEESIT